MKTYTTFEVAELLGVTPHTVINWSKKGHLQCFKTPGGHRRYSRTSVSDFAKTRNLRIFIDEEIASISQHDVLLIEQDENFGGFIKEIIDDSISTNLLFTTNVIEGIYWMGQFRPKVVLLDCNIQNPTATQIMRTVRNQNPNTFFICLLTTLRQKTIFEEDFDSVFLKSSSIVSLIQLIERIVK